MTFSMVVGKLRNQVLLGLSWLEMVSILILILKMNHKEKEKEKGKDNS